MEGGKPVLQLIARNGPGQPPAGVVLATAAAEGASGAPVRLRIAAKGPSYRFSYAIGPNAAWTEIGEIDGHFLSTKTAGGFIGATFGPYAYSPQ